MFVIKRTNRSQKQDFAKVESLTRFVLRLRPHHKHINEELKLMITKDINKFQNCMPVNYLPFSVVYIPVLLQAHLRSFIDTILFVWIGILLHVCLSHSQYFREI